MELKEVLEAKDRRRGIQEQILNDYKCPVLVFTMNIAGEVKRNPLVDFAFRMGVGKILQELGEPTYKKYLLDATGCEAFFAYRFDAGYIKDICVKIEELDPVGRLYDMDVIDIDGQKLSRGEARACIVCGGPVAPCSRSRAHGLDLVKSCTYSILERFAAKQLAVFAVSSLIEEVRLTPKPGLVDQNNSGAHRDMDLDIFLKSAHSLYPYFIKAATLGMRQGGCMKDLQAEGQKAEREMLAVTGGVNTHKGAIYTLGLLLAAMGSRLVRGGDVFSQVRSLAAAGKAPESETHGGEVRRKFNSGGARQEAENGLPHAQRAYRALKDPRNDELTVLLQIVSECPDTNLLYRGGMNGLKYARRWARFILLMPKSMRLKLTEFADRAFNKKNLSPGGCADIFSASLFLLKTDFVWNHKDDN
ncbi:MAG: citrate lyase holo-[acyl-carrier protein] synthase [Bacillota bacterium]|nr:citrate lyase holo-[acyl-carrier protein] synthase [Bacillota bacterium]